MSPSTVQCDGGEERGIVYLGSCPQAPCSGEERCVSRVMSPGTVQWGGERCVSRVVSPGTVQWGGERCVSRVVSPGTVQWGGEVCI